MPLRFSTKAEMPPNLCMECGEVCRRPKRFCTDEHKERWLRETRGIVLNVQPPGTLSTAEQRKRAGITDEARAWRNKLNVQRAF